MADVLRILLVEDDEHDAAAFRHVLERSAVPCTVTRDVRGEAAIERLRANGAFDVVVADNKLPGMSGLDLCKTLLQNGAQCPLVILTGEGTEELAAEALRAGVADYIVKDSGRVYLDILPLVLPQVVRAYRDSAARLRAEEDLREANAKLERQVAARTAELERVAQALRTSEGRYRELVEHAPLGICVCDCAGRILAMNQRLVEMLGAPSEEALREVNVLTAPSLVEAGVAEAVQQCVDTGVGRIHEFSWTTRWDNEVHFRIHLGPMCSVASTVTGVHAVVEDISDRKWMEAEHALLATAVDQVAEMIMIMDADGVIEYVNPAFERLTGYTRDEVVGQTSRLFTTGMDDDEVFADMWATLRRGEAWSGQLTNRTRDGELFQEDAAISPVRDDSGRIVRFVKVMRDVTQENAVRHQVAQSQKMEAVGSLAAGIAHEINTPIQFVGDNVRFFDQAFTDLAAVLRAYACLKDLCKEQGLVPDVLAAVEAAEADVDAAYLLEDVPEAVAQTLEGVERVATIVRAMREFSHPSVGEKRLADLNKALETTLTVARNELKYVADVHVALAPDLPAVECDLGELNQVFLNLLVNAAHAIKDALPQREADKGAITVRTWAEDGEAVIAIEDTGTGIPKRIQDRILEPFFTTKDVGKGTGQGLALAHAVVVGKHGGTLTFESEEGVGTTFYVRLPIHAREAVHAE